MTPPPEINTKPAKNDDWYVYIVLCHDKTLYTGITNDLDRRVQEHNFKKSGARYTRSRRPVQLVFYELIDSRSGALKREHQVRTLPLKKKRELILKSYKKLQNIKSEVKLSTSAIRKIRNP